MNALQWAATIGIGVIFVAVMSLVGTAIYLLSGSIDMDRED